MEVIYLDKKLDVHQIEVLLKGLFPALEVYHDDIFENPQRDYNRSDQRDYNGPDQISFYVSSHPDRKEFQYELWVLWTANKNINEEKREIYIAQKISNDHNLRTLVAFTYPDAPSDPYYDLLFENGKVYLADDYDTSFGDGTENLIKIIREYELPEIKFDEKGYSLS